MKLKEIADIIGGSIIGNPDVEITGVAGIKDAAQGSITFLADKKNLPYAYTTQASAIIAKEEIRGSSACIITVDNPYLAFAKALELFCPPPRRPIGVSKESVIGEDVIFGKDVSVYPNVHISNKVSIGDRVSISPFVYIGENVSIGDDSVIYSNVTIRENVTIGKKAILHSGSIIGSDGFGYAQDKGTHYKIPQTGGVVIEDNVEVGANVTIDRATLGNTLIGSGTKIDNLVHIAHNVKIGRNCIILGQAGISGSVEVGNNVVLAGQVGIADHKKIADGVIVTGKSGVTGDLETGIYSGYPAIPHKEWLRAQSIYAKLPDILRRLHALERKANPGSDSTSHSDGANKEDM